MTDEFPHRDLLAPLAAAPAIGTINTSVGGSPIIVIFSDQPKSGFGGLNVVPLASGDGVQLGNISMPNVVSFAVEDLTIDGLPVTAMSFTPVGPGKVLVQVIRIKDGQVLTDDAGGACAWQTWVAVAAAAPAPGLYGKLVAL